MLIPVPSVDQSAVRLMFGDTKMDVIVGTQKEVEVPDGVEVTAVGLDNGGRAAGEAFVVLEATLASGVEDVPAFGEVTTGPAIRLESSLSLGESPFPEPAVKRGPGPRPEKKGL